MKTICPPAAPGLFRSDRSGVFFNHLRQVALTAVMLAVVVVLATACSSTDAGFNARLISPIPANPQDSSSEDDVSYPPSRGTVLSNSDFLGGA
jgi:hypothetical protein